MSHLRVLSLRVRPRLLFSGLALIQNTVYSAANANFQARIIPRYQNYNAVRFQGGYHRDYCSSTTSYTELIDIREPEELLETGQIPSSTNIPCKNFRFVDTHNVGGLDDALQMSPEDFLSTYGIVKPSVGDNDIVFHCKAGRRSRVALEIAQRNGYTSVRHYYPGMDGWLEQQE